MPVLQMSYNINKDFLKTIWPFLLTALLFLLTTANTHYSLKSLLSTQNIERNGAKPVQQGALYIQLRIFRSIGFNNKGESLYRGLLPFWKTLPSREYSIMNKYSHNISFYKLSLFFEV